MSSLSGLTSLDAVRAVPGTDCLPTELLYQPARDLHTCSTSCPTVPVLRFSLQTVAVLLSACTLLHLPWLAALRVCTSYKKTLTLLAPPDHCYTRQQPVHRQPQPTTLRCASPLSPALFSRRLRLYSPVPKPFLLSFSWHARVQRLQGTRPRSTCGIRQLHPSSSSTPRVSACRKLPIPQALLHPPSASTRPQRLQVIAAYAPRPQ